MMDYRKCVKCGTTKIGSICLYSFPKDPNLRKQWAEFCSIDLRSVKVHHRICSAHFTASSFLAKSSLGRKLKRTFLLKKGAVPSVESANPQLIETEQPVSGPGYLKNCCLFCGAIPSSIHVFRFPKDTHKRKTWLEACGLTQDVNNARICQLHFKPEDVVPLSKRHILREGAVPCSHIPSVTPHTAVSPEKSPLHDDDEVATPPPDEHQTQQMEEDSTVPKLPFNVHYYTGDADYEAIEHTILQGASENRNASLRLENSRLMKKVNILDTMKELREGNMLTEEATLSIQENLPPSLQAIAQRYVSKNKPAQFPEELRNFALSVNFYSPKAYDYIREKWKCLPAVSTIRRWYRIEGGDPGFTKEAFVALEGLSKNSSSPIVCNVVMDEIHVKEHVYVNPVTLQCTGYVDIGVLGAIDNDSRTLATQILVIMVVALNSNWKLPIGYFPVRSLSASEKTSILTLALEMLQETGISVISLTFDGATTDWSMCSKLGANLDIGDPNFKGWFPHPVTHEKVFIIPDASHCLENVRNAVGERGPYFDANGRKISFQHVVELHNYQEKEGITMANKLTVRHVNFEENKMNVRLAAQVLSHSVSVSLRFLNGENLFSENVEGTAEFCSVINDAFDILNCRSLASKKDFCRPIDDINLEKLRTRAEEIIRYICALHDEQGVLVTQGPRKSGFVGLIISLCNVFDIFTAVEEKGMSYLLTYKLLQDAIENFCAIRANGGHRLDPTVKQFQAAYCRLLVHFEVINCSNYNNCSPDDTKYLECSIQRRHLPFDQEDRIAEFLEDHDYIVNNWHISEYLELVVQYIAGFIAFRLNTTLKCKVCAQYLRQPTGRMNSLIQANSKGFLTHPSDDVVTICTSVERHFRQRANLITHRSFSANILYLVRSDVGSCVFSSRDMDEHSNDLRNLHSCSEDCLLDHRQDLITYIVSFYLKIRLCHEIKMQNQPKNYVRWK